MKIAFIDTLGLCYDGTTLSKRGLGGSESAVILMSRELAQIGFEVTVFNDCYSDDATPGVYDGVTYKPLSNVEVDNQFDVVIASRSVAAFAPLEMRGQFKSFTGPLPDFTSIINNARWKVLWMHDTFCDGDQFVEPFVLQNRIDEVFTLSDWHTSYVLTCEHGRKRMYEALKNRVFVTRNGIEKHLDWVDISSKDPDLFVYNASVSKGMIPLVTKVWSRVKQHIPSAKLKVIGGYYKFRSDSPPDEQEQNYRALVEQYDGQLDIEFTGIIRQDEIAQLLAKASYTIYPGVFPETFGISTLESLAYNTPVLTCRFGALEETAVDMACYKIEYPIEPNSLFPMIDTDEQVNAFVNMVVNAYNTPYIHQQKMYACNSVQTICHWSSVAIQWKQHLFRVLGEFMPVDEHRYTASVNSRVREVFGRRMTNIEDRYPPRCQEQHIHVVIPVYNAKDYVSRCIASIAAQDYENYIVTIIDDASTDGTVNVISEALFNLPDAIRNRFTLTVNEENMGAVYNQVSTIRKADCNSIIMLVDGDDWLVNDPNIFHKFNSIYNEGAMFTYGSCWSLADNIPLVAQEYPPEVKQARSYRSHKFAWNMPYTHLRTFRAGLLSLVTDDNFKDEQGQWYKAGGDGSLFYSLLEVADPNTVVALTDIVYNYNDLNPINDYKVNSEEQTRNANMIAPTNETSKLTSSYNAHQQVFQNKQILIAIPTARYIEPDTFKSIYDLEVPDGYETTFQYFYGYNVEQVRNLIADWTIRGFDYLFAVDHDVKFASDTLKKLLAHDKPIVSGVYRQRLEPQVIEVYDTNFRNISYEEIFDKPLVEVGGCGFGCVLVKKEVFEHVGYPQFKYHSALDHKDTFSEDMDFCMKARAAGFGVFVDPTILCGHIGSKEFHVELPKLSEDQRKIKRLRDLRSQPLLPIPHVQYLHKMKNEMGIEPQIVYDLGACVLHWTDPAKEVWPNASFYAIDAMNDAKEIYREAGIPSYTGAVLDEDCDGGVDFYENVEHPGGNSIFKENPDLSPQAEELFPEHAKVWKPKQTLDNIRIIMGWPAPDVIKMDVQGSELKVLKGATETLKTVKHLILELQHKDYNLGAPKADQVIAYLKTIGFELVGDGMFCGSELGVDGDYHFVRTGHVPTKAYVIFNPDNDISVDYAMNHCAPSLERLHMPWEGYMAPYMKTADELWQGDSTLAMYQPTMIPPAASCTAAHFEIWKRIAETGETAIILEHDAVLLDRPGPIPDGKIVALGYKLVDADLRYDHVGAMIEEPREIIDIDHHYGSHAYAITAETARRLLDELKVVGAMVSIDASHFIRDDVRFASSVPLAIMSPTPAICNLKQSTIWSDGAQEINAEFIPSFAKYLRDETVRPE